MPRGSAIDELAAIGQSVWLDELSRPLIDDGRLDALIRAGITGVTSNPTIFARALAGTAYADRVAALGAERLPGDVVDELMAGDIADACDRLLPVWHATEGRDGWVSWEIDPRLADDGRASVAEAARLRMRVPQANLLVKVPATSAGVYAVERLVADGVSVNVTLIFSVERYAAVNDAYMAGLERRAAMGAPLAGVHSVASMFISRLDTAADAQLRNVGTGAAGELRGRLGIAQATLAYAHYRRSTASPRWAALARAGATPQRCLWASTSMRDPGRRDVEYVERLVAPDTIATVAPETLAALLDHGRIAATLTPDADEARAVVEALDRAGIDPHAIALELEQDGVRRFVESADDALRHVRLRAARWATAPTA